MHAFTLLELLLAIAIISVIASLLMSAVSSARNGRDSMQCMNNLRQLVSANMSYAVENDGRFCPAQAQDNMVRWHGERSSLTAQFDATLGTLSPYLGKEQRVKMCPAFYSFIKGSKSFEDGTGGYGYNAIYVGGTPANRWQGELISNISNAPRTVMFTDSALSKPEGVQEYAYCEPWEWVTPTGKLAGALSPSVHFRHSGKANVGWCDGHVSQEVPSRLGAKNYYGGDDKENKIGWFGPSEDNGYWNPLNSKTHN
jgi:prepilin-type processing-associated H-X9-DG protein/prepilin-type N-terminal cleavage/methylation domain-containing protein